MIGNKPAAALTVLLAAFGALNAADKLRTDCYGDPLPPGALARLGTIRLRHLYAAVIFTPDGKELISAGADGTLRYWDAATGKEKRRLRLQVGDSPDPLSAFQLYVFAADGRSLAGCFSHHLFVWDTATGKELKRFPLGKVSIKGREHIPMQVYRLALSRDGKMMAADLYNSADHTIQVWNVRTGKSHLIRKMQEFCNSLTISPDGKLVGTTSNNEGLRLWDTESGKESRTIADARDFPMFSPDGKRLAAPTRAGGVKGWNTADGKECFAIPPMPGVFMGFPTLAPDNKTLAMHTYREGGEELFWDIAAGKQLHAIPGRSGQMVFSPDSKIAAFHGTAIRLWDLATGKEINPRAGHHDSIASMAVAPDGSCIATSSVTARALRLWDASSGQQLLTAAAPKHFVRAAVFSPDGRFFLTIGGDNTLRTWDRKTGKEVRQFPIASADPASKNVRVMEQALSSDGKRVVALAGGWDFRAPRQVSVWDAATGKRLHRRTLSQIVYGTHFSPDARSMAIQRGEDVIIEDAVSGQEIVKFAGRAEPLAFSPDGQIVALADRKPKSPPPGTARERPGEVNAICLFEMATGKRLLRIDTGPVSYKLLAYSPDGRTLSTANRDGFRIWDVATGRKLYQRDLPAQSRGIFSTISFFSLLAYLPSGDRLVTGTRDSTALIWDTEPKRWHAGIAGKSLERRDLERLWSDLAGDDAATAHRAVWLLAAAHDKAVPFLKEHLPPVAALDAKQVQKLITDLDSSEFTVRERANKNLASFGEQAEPALRQALAGKPSLEARRRLEALLADAEKSRRGMVRSAELLRVMRAIRALEHIGDQDARQLLRRLAEGGPGARQTRVAKEALNRLAQRAGSRANPHAYPLDPGAVAR